MRNKTPTKFKSMRKGISKQSVNFDAKSSHRSAQGSVRGRSRGSSSLTSDQSADSFNTAEGCSLAQTDEKKTPKRVSKQKIMPVNYTFNKGHEGSESNYQSTENYEVQGAFDAFKSAKFDDSGRDLYMVSFANIPIPSQSNKESQMAEALEEPASLRSLDSNPFELPKR